MLSRIRTAVKLRTGLMGLGAALLVLSGCLGQGGPAAGSTSKPITLTKPIRLIVNQAAGGDADRLARILEPTLESRLGVEVNVDNVTEASGVEGVNQLYDARPDGSVLATLLLPRTVQQERLLNTKYKTGELTPIAVLRRGIFVLITRKDAPYQSFTDMVEASKRQALTIGTSGAGSATDLQTARLADVAGANFTRVPFQGTAPAATAVLGGHIDGAVVPVEIMRAGDYRALVTPTAQRLPEYPDIPAMSDLGLSAADVAFYQVLFGPPKMDEGLRSTLESVAEAVLADPAIEKTMHDAGMERYFGKGSDLIQLIDDQAKIIDQYKSLLGG